MDEFKANVAKYNSIQDLSSNDAKLDELSKQYTKEYYLFIIWLFITCVIIILLLTTLLYRTESNPFIWIVITIFIVYCSIFIFKNLYYIIYT
jgi:maltodextrin utilization protein YvdJ